MKTPLQPPPSDMKHWNIPVPIAATAVVGVLVTLAAVYFAPWMACWTLIVAGLTLWRPPIGVALLFGAISFDQVRPIVGGLQVGFSEIQAGAVGTAWLAGALGRGKRIDLTPLWISIPFLGAVFVSGLNSGTWVRASAHLLRNSETFLLFFVAANVFVDSESRRPMRLAIALATAFYGVLGLHQLEFARRVFSVFDNPNQFGAYLNLVLPYLLLFTLAEGSNVKRILWLVPLGIGVVSLFLTFSRMAIVAGALGWLAAVFALLRSRHGRTRVDTRERRSRLAAWGAIGGAAVVSILLLSVLTGPAANRFGRQLTFSQQARSLRASFGSRLALLKTGVSIWLRHPVLGVGPGNYPEALSRYWVELEAVERRRLEERIERTVPNPRLRPERLDRALKQFKSAMSAHVHNLYLQLAVEYGLLGLAAFLFCAGKLVLGLRRAAPHSIWPLAAAALLVSAGVHSLADVTFPSLGMEMGLLLGVAWSTSGRRGMAVGCECVPPDADVR